MNSRAKIVIVIGVSLIVPFLALRQRWSEIRAFARNLQVDLTLPTSEAPKASPPSNFGHRSGSNPAITVVGLKPEQIIAQALTSNSDPAAAGRKLLEVFPNLPETEKPVAVQHLTNLVDDSDYAPMSQMLANPETPENIQGVLMADVINRRNSVKLPALLEVARTPNHAHASEARELLKPYLMQDYSEDWVRNEEKLNVWLRTHPDS